MNPALVIGRETAGRDHAVNMRMMLEILPPGVKNAEEADLCAEMLRIGGNLQQTWRRWRETEIINNLLVVQSQPGKFMRDRENHMHVIHRQQFLISFGEPLVAGVGLALWAMPGAAGVEGDGLVAALETAIQVATERCRAAVLDGEEHAQVQPRQPGSVLFDKALPCARMISATSKGGCFIFCAASAIVSLGRGWTVPRCRAACPPPSDGARKGAGKWRWA